MLGPCCDGVPQEAVRQIARLEYAQCEQLLVRSKVIAYRPFFPTGSVPFGMRHRIIKNPIIQGIEHSLQTTPRTGESAPSARARIVATISWSGKNLS